MTTLIGRDRDSWERPVLAATIDEDNGLHSLEEDIGLDDEEEVVQYQKWLKKYEEYVQDAPSPRLAFDQFVFQSCEGSVARSLSQRYVISQRSTNASQQLSSQQSDEVKDVDTLKGFVLQFRRWKREERVCLMTFREYVAANLGVTEANIVERTMPVLEGRINVLMEKQAELFEKEQKAHADADTRAYHHVQRDLEKVDNELDVLYFLLNPDDEYGVPPPSAENEETREMDGSVGSNESDDHVYGTSSHEVDESRVMETEERSVGSGLRQESQLEVDPGFDLGPGTRCSRTRDVDQTLRATRRREERALRMQRVQEMLETQGWAYDPLLGLSLEEQNIVTTNMTRRRAVQEQARSVLIEVGRRRVRDTSTPEQRKTMRECYFSRDRIFRSFGLIREFSLLSVVEAKSPDQVVIATDVPKTNNDTLKWAKAFYAGGEKMIYDALLMTEKRANGGLSFDETMFANIPLPLTMDIEIKKCASALYENGEARFKELYKCPLKDVLVRHFAQTMEFYSTEGHPSTKFDVHRGDIPLDEFCGILASLYRRFSVCDFTEKVCQAGLRATRKHITSMLTGIIGSNNPAINETLRRAAERDDTEEPMADVKTSFCISSGCRPAKFSLHVLMEHVYCDSVNLSMPLVVFEIARWWTRSNARWLVRHYSEWKTADSISDETVFRIRALMVEEMMENKDGIYFRSYKDTMFDEAIYTSKHLMRGVFSRKASSGGTPLIPVLDDKYPLPVGNEKYPLMVHDPSLWHRHNLRQPTMNALLVSRSNPYEKGPVSFDLWRAYTITCRDMSLVTPFNSICFSCTAKVNTSYPKRYELENCRREYLRNGGKNEIDLQAQFTVLTTMEHELYQDTRRTWLNRNRRNISSEALEQHGITASDEYVRRVQVDPEMLVRKEDGQFLFYNPLALLLFEGMPQYTPSFR
jgi:hypothetical protein